MAWLERLEAYEVRLRAALEVCTAPARLELVGVRQGRHGGKPNAPLRNRASMPSAAACRLSGCRISRPAMADDAVCLYWQLLKRINNLLVAIP